MIRGRTLVVLAWVAALGSVACNKGVRGSQTVTGEQNLGRPTLPAEQVQLLEAAGRPTLQLVERKGDPSSAVALAVLSPGGSRDAILLTALLKKRLQAPGRDLQLRTHSLGVVAAIEVGDAGSAATFLSDAAKALTTPVDAEEVVAFTENHLLRSVHARAGEPSPFGACMAQLGNEGAEELLDELKTSQHRARAQRIERVRSRLVTGQIGLSALGDPEVLQAVTQAHDQRWPPAGLIEDSYKSGEDVGVVESSGGRELRLALRLGDSEAALAAARALEQPDHPFRARLASLSSRFEPERTEVTLRPSGACLGMTVAFDSQATAPLPERLAAASVLLLEEMRDSAREAIADQEKTYALLSPRGALEAVGLAAWTAVHARTEPIDWKTIVEYRTPPNEPVEAPALAAAIQETREQWEGRSLRVETHDESGQAELWLLLGSPCGTHSEPIDLAGLRALTVTSLASQFDGLSGVRLLPWVSTHGIGVIAHAPAYRGEPPLAHARRVSRTLGAALSGASLDGRAVAESRAVLLARVGSNPGAELLFDILGGEHPSQLKPYGLERSLATLSLDDVERTRGDLAREPLRLSVLANAGVEQGQAAAQALSRWLAPSRAQVEQCVSTALESPPAKQWTLESIEDGVQPGAYVAVATHGPAELGHATAFLLNQGALIRALDQPGLVSSAVATFWGSSQRGALVVQLGTDDKQMEAAVAQVRGLLDRWSRQGSAPGQVQEANEEWTRRRQQSARSPEGRLVELWVQPKAATIDARSLHIFQKQLGASSHRVVLVKKRR